VEQESINTVFKVVGLLLVLHACYATYLHKTDRITIYSNYTDAAMTGLSPAVSLVVYLLLRFIDVPENVSTLFGLGVFAISVSIIIRHTWLANNSFLSFVSAFIAKYTVLAVYYVLILLVLFGGGNRRKYERRTTASRRHAAALAATTGAYAGWSVWVTKDPEFVSLKEYLAPN